MERGPVALRLLDVSENGRVLVSRVHFRAAASCLVPGQKAERDLSWFDASEVDDMTSDGKAILTTEFGEGGGLGRWGVYLRQTTGEPAVRLGDGQAFALSPDGKMALTMSLDATPEVVLLPTGAGESIRIRNDDITNYEAMDWMPDGQQFVFAGSESGQGVRSYIQAIDGGEPRPITPDGFRFWLGQKAVSPTGEWLAAETDGPPSLFPIQGGDEREIPGVERRWPLDFFEGCRRSAAKHLQGGHRYGEEISLENPCTCRPGRRVRNLVRADLGRRTVVLLHLRATHLGPLFSGGAAVGLLRSVTLARGYLHGSADPCAAILASLSWVPDSSQFARFGEMSPPCRPIRSRPSNF